MRFLNRLLSSKKGELLSIIGIRGALRSVYLSKRHTGRYDSIVLHPNVITDISRESTVEIQPHFLMGTETLPASHPELGKSRLDIQSGATFRVDSETYASIGPCSVVSVEGEFTMGGSYINSHARIICEDEITIGDRCAIAWNVEIMDTNRHELRINGETVQKTAPIVIGDRVWIGHNSVIKKGVTIGDGAVVASGSVVTQDVPENAVVGGVPAEVIAEGTDW